jgi:superfamily II DNA or RNA helicase
MTKKNEIQDNIISEIIRNNFKGIVLSSVRSGKTRILLKSIQKHSEGYVENPKILVLYPNIDIKSSWETECNLINYHPDITYCTFISIDKVKDLIFDYVCIDEAHLLAEETQLLIAAYINKKHKHCIFASGTYNYNTLETIQFHTQLNLIVNYSTEKAIKDGIVSDFNIIIYKYNLDNTIKKEFGKVKKWQSTDQKECNRLSNKVNNTSGKEKMFAALNRMHFINNCDSLVNSVNKWIINNPKLRFILFTGSENVGKKYNIPMWNSKSKDDSVLKAFQNQQINRLCLIKKGKQGITYPMLQHILITNIDSNGENLLQSIGRSLLLDSENKIATAYIFISDQEFQKKWLLKAIEGIDESRITWKII